MIIRKNMRHSERGEWVRVVPADRRGDAQKIHDGYVERATINSNAKYTLSELVRGFGLTHGIDEWQDVAEQVNTVRRDSREPLYHEGRVRDVDLPVDAVISLSRRLMTAALGRAFQREL